MKHSRILRPREAAFYLGLSVSTLAKRRLRGQPPAFVKLTRRAVGYLVAELDQFLETRRRISTSDPGSVEYGGSEDQ